MPIENEYKFTSDDVRNADAYLSKLISFLDSSDIDYVMTDKRYKDEYYDSSEMTIADSGCFLRKRTYSDGKCKLTVKRPISTGGMMAREEIEEESDGSSDKIVDFSRRHFPNADISYFPVLTIECERTVFKLTENNDISLSMDRCRYVDKQRDKSFLEIELELIDSDAKTDFDNHGIINFVKDVLNFRIVSESKYRRGLRWKLDQ